ncbi:SDR family oxidoreductase [Domibacillus epiphyticus]|uniref:NAD(P)-dependent oxidoreductase n=1 Tax=Domibacillus epiphyticus TaxID=1714355 RepID=A0A1V2A3Q5_9BACI|nr:SDR family oxidoreductase [Domibacillus epiphyticus]OMP65629.1 NAD(P)-dependent oxidoreductase [Domibacillus epiphyticus]
MSIAITGATGQLGSRVIQHLLNKHVAADDIIAVVRDKEKASSLVDIGVEVRHGDYDHPDTLENVFAGVDKLFFVSSPYNDDTRRIVQHANVVKAARDAGVKHIVYTSYAFAEESTIALAHVHLATEQAIRTTAIPFTFLRNSLYTEIFVNPALGASVENGAVVTNTGKGRLNTVTRNDLALAAATVLVEDGHENKTYTLVAHKTWSFDTLAQILSDIAGKTIVHKAVSLEEEIEILKKAGLPEHLVFMFSGIYQAISEGEISRTSEDLQKLIGTPTPLEETVKRSLLSEE